MNSQEPARLIFAKNLRKIRRAKGMSQEELALLTGIHRTYISSVERGMRNISIDNMERIASALETSLAEMLTKDN
jgi:transcriptional regulator with XRE-family HTH domain